MKPNELIKNNRCLINLGQPLEIELVDGNVQRGTFYQRWLKETEEPRIVIVEKVSNTQEKFHYIVESQIHDIRILGPDGTPILYRIK
jgi:hypothetical protein